MEEKIVINAIKRFSFLNEQQIDLELAELFDIDIERVREIKHQTQS